jgi:hypothetical protein
MEKLYASRVSDCVARRVLNILTTHHSPDELSQPSPLHFTHSNINDYNLIKKLVKAATVPSSSNVVIQKYRGHGNLSRPIVHMQKNV